jgi:alpha-tubulin suppressor-like RCC1 family protein
VWCWGRNMSGQLGDMSIMQRTLATQVVNLGGVSAIATGWNHSCAVKSADGSVWCWGSNAGGQLGIGTSGMMTNSNVPVQVMGLTGVTQISAGELHTCARKSDGTAWCWGKNDKGQLGNDTTTDSNVPVQVKFFQGTVKNLTGVLEVAAGQTHSCARLAGEVRCWGLNGNGQLGNNSTTDSARAALVSNLTTPASLAAGGKHACATLTTGTEVCWGLNGSGQLGNGSAMQSLVPAPVSTLTKIAGIGAGDAHSCAFLETETTQCWGSDSQGQLGNGNGGNTSTPGPVTLTCP